MLFIHKPDIISLGLDSHCCQENTKHLIDIILLKEILLHVFSTCPECLLSASTSLLYDSVHRLPQAAMRLCAHHTLELCYLFYTSLYFPPESSTILLQWETKTFTLTFILTTRFFLLKGNRDDRQHFRLCALCLSDKNRTFPTFL